MSEAIKEYYINTFERYICSACKLCGPDGPGLPAFCMAMYGANQDRFFEILKYIKVLQAMGTSDDVCTFEGFCGLFCNSQKVCPRKNEECKTLKSVFSCYEAFARQSGVTIPTKIKTGIWEKFSGIEMRNIGKEHRLPTKNILIPIDKKKRKKINKLIRKTKTGLRTELQFYGSMRAAKVIARKRKKPVVTTLFCNDDEEWIKKIDSYLESNETNNRQSVENA